MSDSAIYLCRCERITRDRVTAAIAEGNQTINDIKRRTRAGMGLCQGIFCTNAMAACLIDAGQQPESIEPMTWRPPTRIVEVAVVASESKT